MKTSDLGQASRNARAAPKGDLGAQNWKAFTIKGVPAPKPVGRRTAKSADGWARYAAWKWLIGYTANRYYPYPLAGAVALSCLFYLPAPAAIADLKGEGRRQVIRGKTVPTGKPDLKNFVAAVEDSLTAIAWHDDAQVVTYGFMEKRWDVAGKPRAFVVIEALPEGLAGLRQYTGYPLNRYLETEQNLGD